MRRYSLALAVTFCLVYLLAAPYFIDVRDTGLGLRGAAVLAASRDAYSLTSPVQLLSAPKVALESGTLSMPLGSSGLARGGEVISMLITGRGARMALENATLSADFATGGAAPGQQADTDAIAPLVAALREMQFDTLAVRDSTLNLKMADGHLLVLKNLTADVTAKPNGTVRIAGSFVFRGEKVEFDTTFATKADAQTGTRPITASLASKLLAANLEGQYVVAERPRLLADQAELVVPNVRDAARWLGAGQLPGSGFENFRVLGQLDWLGRTIAFQEATVKMDGNEATGTLSLNFGGPRPSIDGTLGFKTLDLSGYLPAASTTPKASDDKAGEEESLLSLVSTAHGFEFPLIQSIDADLRISSDSVVVPGLTIGRSAATVSLKGGKMIADIAELEIDEGTRGGGQLRIDASGPQPSYDIRGKLEALDVGRAAQAVFGHPTIQGRGDVIVEISAFGDTGATLLGSLDGRLSVLLKDGGRLGLDLNRLIADAKSPEPATVWKAASNGAILVDTLDAHFAVANGIIRTESAEAMSGPRAVKAEGVINLPARQLDLELAIGDRPAPDASDTKLKPTQVIDMRGPWAKPDVEPIVPVSTSAQAPRNPG